ncbi:MAG TPA: hypothetical protein PK439_08370 [Nitrosomonas sp.]|nr:hypothetical protein [Nitrosomonas sp.]HRB78419.1 hypothetical protein [Nitrosomonas sp.]
MTFDFDNSSFELESEELKEIEKLIAQTHGFYLSRDDPILILYTLNKLIMKENINLLSKAMKTFKEEMALEALKWSDSSNIAAEKVFSMTLNAHEIAMNKLFEKIAVKISTEIEARYSSVQKQEIFGRDSLKLAVIMSFIASFITLASTLIVVI